MASIEQKFGGRIRRLREERGWTQEDLSAESGISTRSLSSIENGVYSATLETVAGLAAAFRMKVKDLFDF
ncbi:MAG TPA: helix-turn-helix transcriptional regulator [Gammaproteobacteria bacterium]